MVKFSAFDCFTMIQVPLTMMGHRYSVVHGVGPVETGAHYIRSDLRSNRDEYYRWLKMGYLWTSFIGWDDPVQVVRMCRDRRALPDFTERLSESYRDANLEDIAVTNSVPRWVRVFQYLYGDSTSRKGDGFRQETLSPGCSPHNADKCTSKDILKLAHMGDIAVDSPYNCFVESMRPDSGDIPKYTFDKVLRVEDIVDKTISTNTAVRTTLAADPTGRETAIVMILGRVHLIRKDANQFAWYLVNRVGKGGNKNRLLSQGLEDFLKGRTKYSEVSGRYPEYLISPKTQQISGYLSCPKTNVPTVGLRFKNWWKNLP